MVKSMYDQANFKEEDCSLMVAQCLTDTCFVGGEEGGDTVTLKPFQVPFQPLQVCIFVGSL